MWGRGSWQGMVGEAAAGVATKSHVGFPHNGYQAFAWVSGDKGMAESWGGVTMGGDRVGVTSKEQS